MTTTPKPMLGTWTLIAPDGRKWEGDSPLRVVGLESRERVPAEVSLARMMAAAMEADPPGVNVCVDRFLGWKLPKDFSPDCGISFDAAKLAPWPDAWPTGTNLLTATQAKEMFACVLDPMVARLSMSSDLVAALQDPGTDRSEGGEMNFCRDCKHYFNGQCKSPQAATERDPIAGDWPMARLMRLSESRACGTVKARWFEQKEKVNP